jgi:hypothetical protein
MCGRFTATAAFDVLTERFGITVEATARSATPYPGRGDLV